MVGERGGVWMGFERVGVRGRLERVRELRGG